MLIHSPLVGPFTMTPLADELRHRGWAAAVPDLRPALTAPRRQAQRAIDLACASTMPDVVIGHSGAGALLPSIAERLHPANVVFVDALVPPIGESYVTSTAFAEFIDSLSNDGPLLPPWHTWWGPDMIATLVPDDDLRRRLTEDVPRVPRSFYADPVELPPHWPAGAGWAYGQLSSAYDDDAARARSFGWPTASIAGTSGNHLDLVTRPGMVCDLIMNLINGGK